MRSKHLNMIGALGALSASVLRDLKKNSGLFSRVDPGYFRLKPHERDEKITQLQASLPDDPDLLFRGTEGTKEIIDAMESGILGLSSTQRKKAQNHDIVAFIRENDSRYFFSTSPCKHTVQFYAAGISLIPGKGAIWVIGLPRVYTCPQKLLHLNRKKFEEYDIKKIEQQDPDLPTRHDPITTMTANNNEVTVILGATDKDDWSFNVSRDVKSIIQVSGPGLFGTFMSSNKIVHIQDWENPDFRKRVWSMEIIVGDPEDYDEMSQKAREMGLIAPDMRCLTLEDASATVDSKELTEMNDRYTTDRTHRLTQVPKEISLGDKDALLEYMIYEIESELTLEDMIEGSLRV